MGAEECMKSRYYVDSKARHGGTMAERKKKR